MSGSSRARIIARADRLAIGGHPAADALTSGYRLAFTVAAVLVATALVTAVALGAGRGRPAPVGAGRPGT